MCLFSKHAIKTFCKYISIYSLFFIINHDDMICMVHSHMQKQRTCWYDPYQLHLICKMFLIHPRLRWRWQFLILPDLLRSNKNAFLLEVHSTRCVKSLSSSSLSLLPLFESLRCTTIDFKRCENVFCLLRCVCWDIRYWTELGWLHLNLISN